MKQKLLAYGTCLILVIIGWIYSLSLSDVETESFSEVMAKGLILEMNLVEPETPIDSEAAETENFISSPFGTQYDVDVKILSGPYKGIVMATSHYYNNDPFYDILIEPGDKVVLSLDIEDDQLIDAHISDFYRASYLWVLLCLFILAILLIGKSHGLKTILSLVLTGLGIVTILMPAILAGKNPVTVTIFVCTGITIITHMLITGFTKKSVAAISGTFFGIVVGGFLAQNVISLAHISGLSSEESRMFFYGYGDGVIDITGLLFSGIVIGSLGAVMDVSMSIASAMQEIHETDPKLRGSALAKKGMNVGRDIIGTMSNTLILANTGSALPLMLLIQANSIPYMKYINLDMIATEIIRSLSGSIGLFVAVPFTAFISAFLYTTKRRKATRT